MNTALLVQDTLACLKYWRRMSVWIQKSQLPSKNSSPSVVSFHFYYQKLWVLTGIIQTLSGIYPRSEDKLWTDKEDSLITVQADLIIWPSPERPPIAGPQTRTSDPMFLVHIIGTRDFSLNHYLLVISNSCSELPF